MPDFLAQMRGTADPFKVSSDVVTRVYATWRLPVSDGPELYLPYAGPTPAPVVSVSAYEAHANAGLVEFHDVWMNFLEGNNHG